MVLLRAYQPSKLTPLNRETRMFWERTSGDLCLNAQVLFSQKYFFKNLLWRTRCLLSPHLGTTTGFSDQLFLSPLRVPISRGVGRVGDLESGGASSHSLEQSNEQALGLLEERARLIKEVCGADAARIEESIVYYAVYLLLRIKTPCAVLIDRIQP